MQQPNIQNTPTPPVNISPPAKAQTGAAESVWADFAPDAYYGEGRWSRFVQGLRDFFSDRRKILIFGAVLVLLAAGLTAFLVLRNRSEPVPGEQPNPSRGELPLAGAGLADFVPEIFRPGNGTIVVEWSLDRPTDGRVDYGTSNKYGWFADDPNTLTPEHFQDTHRVVLRDLEPSITYHLLASSADKEGNIFYSTDFAVRPIADGSAPVVSFVRPKAGDKLSGVEAVCADAKDERLVSLTLTVNGKPVAQKNKNFSECFLLDTRNYKDGSYELGFVAYDGTNSTKAEVKVIFDNSGLGGIARNRRIGGSDFDKDGIPNILDNDDDNDGTPDNRDNDDDNDGVADDKDNDDDNDGINDSEDPDNTGNTGGGGCAGVDSNLVVQLTAPKDNSLVSGTVPISATVNKQVSVVYFLINNEIISQDASSPYIVDLFSRRFLDGQYLVKAVAQTGAGLCSNASDNGPHTARITIKNDVVCARIDNNLAVSLTSPANNTKISGQTSVKAAVTAPNLTVRQVFFSIRPKSSGADAIFAAAVSPYQSILDTYRYTNGDYMIKAVVQAESSDGSYVCSNQSDSGPHVASVVIENSDLPPGCDSIDTSVAANITEPGRGAILRGDAPVAASLSNPNNKMVKHMAFAVGDSRFAIDETAPYNGSLRTTDYSNGSHVLMAYPVLENNVCGSPSRVAVEVQNNSTVGCEVTDARMSVKFTKPANNTRVSGPVTLESEVSALQGLAVKGVRYLLDTHKLLGEGAVASYAFNFDSAAFSDGNHTATALAYTDDGRCSNPADLTLDFYNHNNPGDLVISFVSVQKAATSLTVRWQTNREAGSRVDFNSNVSQFNSNTFAGNRQSTSLTRQHELTVDSLLPSTTYYLLISSADTAGRQAKASLQAATEAVRSPCLEVGSGVFNGCYYDDLGFANLKFTRSDAEIDFDWTGTSPDPARMQPTDFSVIWQGNFNFESGRYQFELNTDDGARVYLNDEAAPLINAWYDQPATQHRSVRELSGAVKVKVEYYQKAADSIISLAWTKLPPDCSASGENVEVAIDSPSADADIAGDVEVRATPNKPIRTMFFYIDEIQFGSDDTAPYSAVLPTRAYTNGRHQIKAVAQESNGACSGGESNGIQVNINNRAFAISNVQAATTDISATITFTTNERANSVLEYGETPEPAAWSAAQKISIAANQTTSAAGGNFNYRVQLDNLKFDTVYHYRIKAASAANTANNTETQLLNFQTLAKSAFNNLTASVSWSAGCSLDATAYYSRYDLTPYATAAALENFVSANQAASGKVSAFRTGGDPWHYTAIIFGLTSSAKYYYRYAPTCDGGVSAIQTFNTP